MQRIRQAARAICIPICAFTSGRFQLADSQSLCCEEAALLGRKCHAEEHPLCCNPSSVEFLKSSSLATDEKARPDDVVKMWLVKRGSERVGAKLVRYSLLTLIIFMLVCTILAIILVTFASNYSPALNDRAQGIILILLLIGLNYAVGLVALVSLVKYKTAVLALFGAIDFCLACLCMLSTHQGHHIGNWGALVMFASSSLLSALVVLQTCQEQAVRRTCSVQNASVNCYHHSSEDWYDYGSTNTSEKDELIPSNWLQSALPYHYHHSDLAAISTDSVQDETAAAAAAAAATASLQSAALAAAAIHPTHSPSSPTTICTVETNERHFLRGDRYAL